MSYSFSVANQGASPRLAPSNGRSRASRALKQTASRTARESARYPSRKAAPMPPESSDWEAVQKMFMASRAKFLRMAYAILRNKEDAEDALQDALLSAGLHLRSFEGRSAPSTWFTRIVLNAALMIRRKRKNLGIDSIPESPNDEEVSWSERIPSPRPDPEIACAEGETFQLVDVLLGEMSPVLRQAFTMTYYDELSSREAVARLGITTGTFKSRLFRARQHLKNHAQRSLVAPIRTLKHSAYSSSKDDFRAFAARSVEMSAPEMAFS